MVVLKVFKGITNFNMQNAILLFFENTCYAHLQRIKRNTYNTNDYIGIFLYCIIKNK